MFLFIFPGILAERSISNSEWYISYKGSDVAGCGSTPDFPCSSVGHVLSLGERGQTFFIDGSSTSYQYDLCGGREDIVTFSSQSVRGYNGIPQLGCNGASQYRGTVMFDGGMTSGEIFIADVSMKQLTLHVKDISLYIANANLYNVSIYNGSGCDLLHLYISNSTFDHVQSCPFEDHDSCATIEHLKLACKSIAIHMDRTHFSDSCFSVMGLNYLYINVDDCQFTKADLQDTGTLGGIKVYMPSNNGTVIVRNSLFENQIHTNPIFSAINIEQSALRTSVFDRKGYRRNVTVIVQDSVFRKNERAISMTHEMTRVLIERCRFEDNTAMHSAAAMRLALSNNTQVIVRSCEFVNNAAGSTSHQQENGRFKFDIDQVHIDSTCVKGVVSLVGKGGAIRVNKASVVLWNCTFINNTARLLGGAMYIDRDNEATITDSYFENTDRHVHSMQGDIIYSSGKLVAQNTEFFVLTADDHTAMLRHSGNHWSMETYSLWFQCPVGHRLLYVNTTSHKVQKDVGLMRSHKLDQLLYYCKTCGDNQYSLDYGFLNFTLMNNQTEYFTLLINGNKPFKYHAVDFVYGNISCHECPYGAKCDHGIASVPNFWGYKKGSLAYFQHCPDDYCCSTRQCYSIDGCAHNRVGRLCGQCDEGYTEALFSSRCVPNDRCGNIYIWPSIGLMGLIYTFFLIFQGDIKVFVFTWGFDSECKPGFKGCQKKAVVAADDDTEMLRITTSNGVCTNVEPEPTDGNGDLSRRESSTKDVMTRLTSDNGDAANITEQSIPPPAEDTAKRPNGGFLITLFYYFQDALLLHISTVYTKTVSKFQKQLKSFLLGFFRFRLDFYQFMDDICLFPNLQPVPKTMYKAVFVAYIILLFGIIYTLHKCFKRYRPGIIRRLSMRGMISDSTLHSNKLFSSKLAGGFILAFLFTYQKMATTTFTLLNCVPVGNESVLFIDGTQACFQPWQYAVIAYACACVLPFSIVLMVGPPLLKNGHITLCSFFFGCTLPLPALILWTITCLARRTRRSPPANLSKDVTAVLEIVQGPFKEPKPGRLLSQICWSGVLIGRRLILFLCFTFINDVLVRLLCMLAVCFSILLHHVYVRPYNTPMGNLAGALSAAALLVVGGINLIRASFEVAEYVPMGPNKYLMEVFEELENVLLLWLPLAGMCILLLLLIIRLFCIVTEQLHKLLSHS